MHIITGRTNKFIFIQRSTKMETPNKKNVRNMYTTLKECLTNQAWLKAYEKLKRDTSNIIRNHLYDD